MKQGFYIKWHCSALQLILLGCRKPLLRNSHITPNSFLDLGSRMLFRSHIAKLLLKSLSDLAFHAHNVAQSHLDFSQSDAPSSVLAGRD